MQLTRPLLAATFCLFVVGTTAPSVHAAWTSGEGEYLFGPETAEAVACSLATERAKVDALRKVHGETITADQTLSCREKRSASADEPECQANRMLWSQIGGMLRSSRVVKMDVNDITGARSCRVRLVADVATTIKSPPHDFDIAVSTTSTVYRVGEKLWIELAPTRPMHVAIFNWLPYEPSERQVVRLFPNRYDQSDLIRERLTIPTAGYSFTLRLPEMAPSGRSFIDEYLLVVISEDPMAWRGSYSLQELQSRIAEMPSDRVRFIKRGYQLVLPLSNQSSRSEHVENN